MSKLSADHPGGARKPKKEGSEEELLSGPDNSGKARASRGD